MDQPAGGGSEPKLRFIGGTVGAMAPLAVFLGGVGWLGLSGAPDERGFWPILLAAIAAGLILARDRRAYADTVLDGMSQRIVMVMVMAWLLAGVLGAIMGASGFIEALVAAARWIGVSGRGFVATTFLICCAVSTSTGTSLGTILLCAPLLYPAGGALGSDPVALIGAVIGGATFGDNISPVSDTTIASATTQNADLGGVVRSRIKYAIPAAALALVLYVLVGAGEVVPGAGPVAPEVEHDLRGLVMLGAPVVAIGVLLARRHLLEGLMFGILTALLTGLLFGLIAPGEILYIDPDAFLARGLILDGMQRAVGVSIFTILLMGLVAGVEGAGLLRRFVAFATARTHSARGAEAWIFGTVSGAVLLTTHSVVAILATGRFASETGGRFGISPYRRANLLDMTVCTYPFLLPFFIPTILASSTTASGVAFGMPRVDSLSVGLFNFYSWVLLLVVIFAIVTGVGRTVGTGPRGE